MASVREDVQGWSSAVLLVLLVVEVVLVVVVEVVVVVVVGFAFPGCACARARQRRSSKCPIPRTWRYWLFAQMAAPHLLELCYNTAQVQPSIS